MVAKLVLGHHAHCMLESHGEESSKPTQKYKNKFSIQGNSKKTFPYNFILEQHSINALNFNQ